MIGIIDYGEKLNDLWEKEGKSILRKSNLILEEVKSYLIDIHQEIYLKKSIKMENMIWP